MSKLCPLIIIGGGGHASVLVDILIRQNRTIKAVISPDCIRSRRVFREVLRLKSDSDIESYAPRDVLLVNGIGPSPRLNVRQEINNYFIEKGYQFETVISDSAQVSSHAVLSEGVQILQGAIVQAGVLIGEHSIINTGAIVEHDSCLGSYNHVAPNATLCGQVTTGQNVYVGAGAVVINNMTIGTNSVVGAGATLTSSLGAGRTCYPSRALIK